MIWKNSEIRWTKLIHYILKISEWWKKAQKCNLFIILSKNYYNAEDILCNNRIKQTGVSDINVTGKPDYLNEIHLAK